MEMLGKFGEATCAFYLQEVPIKKEEEIPHSFLQICPYQEATTIELLNIDKVTLLNQHAIELVVIPELIS